MKGKSMGRREAVSRLTKLVAGAAGLSAVEMNPLLASVRGQISTRDPQAFEKLLNIQPSMIEAKILRILIFPRQDIYVNEFGRNPIIEFGDFAEGACQDLMSIGGGSWTAKGGTCDDNLCDRQSCGTLEKCTGTNECGEQSCPNLTWPGARINNTNLYSAASLERIKNDPFIVALTKWFGATNSQALSTELRNLMAQRRTTIR